MTDTPKITPADAGCWLDGAMGWHNAYRVVWRANDYGMPLSDSERAVLDYYAEHGSDPDAEPITLSDGATVDVDYAHDWINDRGDGLSDRATDYLQSLAPDGYVFVWDAGELDLMEESEATDYGYLG